jgi:hypothetical protein
MAWCTIANNHLLLAITNHCQVVIDGYCRAAIECNSVHHPSCGFSPFLKGFEMYVFTVFVEGKKEQKIQLVFNVSIDTYIRCTRLKHTNKTHTLN